ncbi:30S ribosomal protein S4 [bioreactor metagenome]|uniref:30S ribosomal protein S4 n=1 Tax=bioreactor metagenome TaxID=1076179 RepID=A0A644T5T4_9ZZZZ|nr:30S ribosomal protein S4 [Candidatus Elulimicrobiales bacterium]
MMDKKCKICRRAGEKLFLKGERCFTPRCAMNNRPYAPGKLDSEKKRRSPISEYGIQMKEKQKIKNIYGVSEKQFVAYVKNAENSTVNTKIAPALGAYINLETRLDNIVFRMGLAKSRALSRQMVAHGHIIVNGKKINIPSHRVRVGDVISVREGSKNTKLFNEASAKLKDFSSPDWLALDAAKLEAKVSSLPKEIEGGFDFAKVLEFYSR